MNEMMTFPDTWEEYEKSYGFTDNEEVYTNGARLIPSFRVKQWLDHLLSVHSELSNNSTKLDKENGELISREEVLKLPQRKGYAVNGWETYIRVSDIENLPPVQPDVPDTNVGELISRQAAIDGVKTLHDVAWKNWHEPTLSANVVLDMIRELPSVQPKQKWETCFDCPLSCGCPKINGYTNGQTMEYASEVPDDCPISAQPRKGKWKDYSDEGYVECPFCYSATNCDGDKDDLHYCFSCGAELR